MLSRIIAPLCLSFSVAFPAIAQDTTLVFNLFVPPNHFMHQELTAWATEVSDVTEGRVAIDIPAGSLAPPPQQYSAVTSGIADIAVTANVFLARKEPLITYSMLPFLVSDAEAASVALWRSYQGPLADAGLYGDAHILSLFHFAGGQLYSLDETPVNSIDDLTSRKMWALPGTATNLMVALGASPVTTPAVQISEPVSTGVVDGVFGLSLESAVDFRSAEYTKAITEFPVWISSVSFTMLINQDKWDALSDADRAAISSISGEALSARVGKVANAAYLGARQIMADQGITYTPADAAFVAALTDAGQSQFDAYVAMATERGVDGQAVIDSFLAEMAAYGE